MDPDYSSGGIDGAFQGGDDITTAYFIPYFGPNYAVVMAIIIFLIIVIVYLYMKEGMNPTATMNLQVAPMGASEAMSSSSAASGGGGGADDWSTAGFTMASSDADIAKSPYCTAYYATPAGAAATTSGKEGYLASPPVSDQALMNAMNGS
ncbi:MAG: hypothetical protein ACYCPT_03810 [Acidimicrobiales bacterium]